MVSIRDNKAYTGATYTSNSKLLSSKNTFYSECILNNIDFNFNALLKVTDAINVKKIYPRSILTEDTLRKTINELHLNNLRLYAAGVGYNSKYLSLLDKTINTLPLTFCLTSFNSSFTGYSLPLYRVPGASNNINFFGTNLLNRYNNSIFITELSAGRFEYFNNFGSFQGILSSTSNSSLQQGIVDNTRRFTHNNIYYDKYNRLIYEVNNLNYNIYTFDWASVARSLTLKDSLRLSFLNTPGSTKTNAFGQTYRCVIAITNGEYSLEIYKVKGVELVKSFTSSFFKMVNFRQVCMRFEDDVTVLVGTNESKQEVMKVFDITQLIQTGEVITDSILDNTSFGDVYEFSPFDSNVVFEKNTSNADGGFINKFAFRSITSPRAPLVTFIPNNNLVFFFKTDVVEKLTNPIETDPTPLGINILPSNRPILKDIKFNVTETINSICVYSDSFDVTTSSLINTIPSSELPIRFKQQKISGNSIGLTINNILTDIIEDTIALYYAYTSKREFDGIYNSNFNSATVLGDVNVDNLIIYGNEYLNAGVFNRIVNKISDLQYKLAVAISNNT
jgi:hypothetical protein